MKTVSEKLQLRGSKGQAGIGTMAGAHIGPAIASKEPIPQLTSAEAE